MPSLTDAREQATAASGVEAPPSDARPAKAVKPPATPKVPTACACQVPTTDKYPGCNGALSTRKFAPGHDAKLVGYLTRRVAAGESTEEAALADLASKSGNSALLVGKLRAALQRESAKADAKARREHAAREAKEAKDAAKADSDAEAAASA